MTESTQVLATQVLVTQVPAQRRGERCIPVLETARLTLRAPRLADVKAIVHFANDRRVAENTARIPHPYRADDAEQFIAAVNRRDGQATFVIVLKGEIIGMCGVEPRDGSAEIGYWLGAQYWNRGYATEAAASRRPREQPGFAPGAGRVRLSMDRRRPLPHPRHQVLGAARPFPP